MVFSKLKELCNHHPNSDVDDFRHHTESLCPSVADPCSQLQPQATTTSAFLCKCVFSRLLYKLNILCIMSCIWLLSLTIMFLTFNNVEGSVSSSLPAEQHSIVRVHHIFFIYSPADRYLDSFYLLDIMKNAATRFKYFMGIFFHSTLWLYSKFMHNFLRDYQIILQRGHLTFPFTKYNGSRFSTSSPTKL